MNFTNDHRFSGGTAGDSQRVVLSPPAHFGLRVSNCFVGRVGNRNFPPAVLNQRLEERLEPIFAWIDNDLLR
jgi:hypothetical protein